MNYPLISEYIEAAKSAEDNFKELTNLRPVLGDDGKPVMTSGNFAVVFKMEDTETGKLYALKCFTKEQEGRAEAYHQIAEELKDVDSPYLVSLRFLEKELFVDTDQTSETEFPVLLMDWVEGKTLDKYLRETIDDKYALEMLAYRFSQLAQWLIPQPFAHGDLKPDNILVREDGTLVLVDYDGMYVPTMNGRKSIELGSPNYRHPQRTENDFNEHIDDFSIANILLSLKAISLDPSLYRTFATGDKLLFEEKDYQRINENAVIPLLNKYLDDSELANLLGVFLVLLNSRYFPQNISSLIDLHGQDGTVNTMFSEYEIKEKILLFYKSIDIYFPKIVYLIPDLFHNGMREYWLPIRMWSMCNVESIWWDDSTYKSIYRFGVEYDAIRYSVVGEFSQKSRPDIMKLPNGLITRDFNYMVNYTYSILFEMGVSQYFADNVDKLITVVNRNKQEYNLCKEDLPF